MNDRIKELVKHIAAAHHNFADAAKFVADEKKLVQRARDVAVACTEFIEAVDVGVMKEPWER
jgi:F0F1-type ATP synthase assembly protein I